MTLRNMMLAVFAGLALAACNSHNGGNDDHTGSNDTPVDIDPFSGDDQVELTFAPQFGGVAEECDVQLTCTSGEETQTTSGPSSGVFSVDRGASCDYALGARGICENASLCHESADGRLWTKSGDLGTLTESQEVPAVANWFFETPKITCVIQYEGQEPYEYTAFDVYVDGKNIFEIDGIASDGSWFEVLGDSFDYGGRALERGWGVLDLTIGANAANFTVDRVTGTFDVSCTWW